MPNFHEPTIVNKATPIYRAILLECERRRQELGWSMWQVDDAAGLQDGHYGKCLHADRPSGRQAQWPTVHLIVTALFPEGFDVQLTRKPGGAMSAEGCRTKIRFAAADHDRISRRKLMSELGRKGGEVRSRLPKARRVEIAQKSAETRKANAIARSKVSIVARHDACVGGDAEAAASSAA